MKSVNTSREYCLVFHEGYHYCILVSEKTKFYKMAKASNRDDEGYDAFTKKWYRREIVLHHFSFSNPGYLED
jgi:hypothetical protein